MTGPRNVTATFDLQSTHFRLSVQKWGSGSGTVTSVDGHINCGSACFYDYNPGDNVTLNPQPMQGSVFSGWVGCDQVQNDTCYVKMSAVRNVTAKLNPATYTLTVDNDGNGTISSGDGHINCGATCSHAYLRGSRVVLTALAGQGWALAEWTGCDKSNGNVCWIAINNARNVSASFKVIYALTVSKSGGGLVVSGNINCGAMCSATYLDGATVRLTGNPSPGYTLDSWTGCDEAQASFCLVAMSGARSATAKFTPTHVYRTDMVLNRVAAGPPVETRSLRGSRSQVNDRTSKVVMRAGRTTADKAVAAGYAPIAVAAVRNR